MHRLQRELPSLRTDALPHCPRSPFLERASCHRQSRCSSFSYFFWLVFSLNGLQAKGKGGLWFGSPVEDHVRARGIWPEEHDKDARQVCVHASHKLVHKNWTETSICCCCGKEEIKTAKSELCVCVCMVIFLRLSFMPRTF